MILMFLTICKYAMPSRLEIRDIDDFKDIYASIYHQKLTNSLALLFCSYTYIIGFELFKII